MLFQPPSCDIRSGTPPAALLFTQTYFRLYCEGDVCSVVLVSYVVMSPGYLLVSSFQPLLATSLDSARLLCQLYLLDLPLPLQCMHGGHQGGITTPTLSGLGIPRGHRFSSPIAVGLPKCLCKVIKYLLWEEYFGGHPKKTPCINTVEPIKTIPQVTLKKL